MLHVLFVLASVAISAFALMEIRIVFGYLRARSGKALAPQERASSPPPAKVTVQLPIYNEPQVALDLIEAVNALDYPEGCFDVQILDDSSDKTTAMISELLSRIDPEQSRFTHVRRGNREGYKAGALAYGMTLSDSEFFAIFDADFIPPKDFLRSLIIDKNSFSDEKVAFVQARWAFYNLRQNILTRVQSLLIDRHFFVQKPYQSSNGRTIHFNGSGGIWRKSAIEAAGGWTADTLCEDLDLSYRIAILGLKGIYEKDVACPSEIPPNMRAFKLQQRRWAKGSAQCARKLLPGVLRSSGLPSRADDVHILLGYMIHPILLLFTLMWPWLVMGGTDQTFLWACQTALMLGNLAALIGFSATYYARDDAPAHKGRAVVDVFFSMVLGITLMVNNSIAFLSGLFLKEGEFERTPKSGQTVPDTKLVKSSLHWTFFAECTVTVYAIVAATLMFREGHLLWGQQTLLLGLALLCAVLVQLRDAVFLDRPLASKIPVAAEPSRN